MRRRPPALPVVLGVLLVLFLLLPTAAVLWRGASFWHLLSGPVALSALKVSAWTSLSATLLAALLGTPVAYLLARYRFPFRTALDTLLDLPIVLPPVVAGLGLLLAFGRRGLLGPPLELAGVSLAFSPAAVVLAALFTSAPYYLRAAKSGFGAVDPDIEAAARTDGAGTRAVFWRVTLPLAWPFLLEGLILTWARALGEFGATILFAGSLTGTTRTVPLAIYAALESDLGPALALASVMVVFAYALLFAVRAAGSRAAGLR